MHSMEEPPSLLVATIRRPAWSCTTTKVLVHMHALLSHFLFKVWAKYWIFALLLLLASGKNKSKSACARMYSTRRADLLSRAL